MNSLRILARVKGQYQKASSSFLFRRPIEMSNSVSYISFTFDDFPRTALHRGGDILLRFGLNGTYYASIGLMGTVAPVGKIFESSDLIDLTERGHELGCHTFAHCHAWDTNPKAFEDSIIKNRNALEKILPGAVFRSLSYPIEKPRPQVKRNAGKYFCCCRGGGQTYNNGKIDLNLLKAFFLEKSRAKPDFVKALIDENCRSKGWLIFATHDISESPTNYGCTPLFFENIVKYSIDSGSIILPVSKVIDSIKISSKIN